MHLQFVADLFLCLCTFFGDSMVSTAGRAKRGLRIYVRIRTQAFGSHKGDDMELVRKSRYGEKE